MEIVTLNAILNVVQLLGLAWLRYKGQCQQEEIDALKEIIKRQQIPGMQHKRPGKE